MHVNSGTWVRAAVECINNAYSIQEDVRVLVARGSKRAITLSIIGLEELGKAVIFVIAALPPFDGFRQRVPKLVTDHPRKQIAASIATISWGLIEDYLAGMEAEYPEAVPEPRERYVGQWLVDIIEDQSVKDLVTNRQEATTMSGDANQIKMRSLYVDLDFQTGNVTTPEQIDSVDMELWTLRFTNSLKAMKPVKCVLEDKKLWNNVVNRVVNRISAETLKVWNT